MKTAIDEFFKNSKLNILDIQRAGCVVFHIPENADVEVSQAFTEKLKSWAQSIGVNVLVLPSNVQVSAIPREVLTDSSFHVRLELLEKKMKSLTNAFKLPGVDVEDVNFTEEAETVVSVKDAV